MPVHDLSSPTKGYRQQDAFVGIANGLEKVQGKMWVKILGNYWGEIYMQKYFPKNLAQILDDRITPTPHFVIFAPPPSKFKISSQILKLSSISATLPTATLIQQS